MKRILKKVLLSLILVVVLTNFIVGPKVYAGNLLEEALDAMMGTVIGLLTKPFRAVALLIADAIDSLAGILAWSQGSIDENGKIVEGTFFSDKTLTPYDILFNKVALLDVNFFNIPEDGTVISNMRLAVAGWYYVMRNIAATILLCVLIYVGIRMAISTVASDKAAFKKMLVDWVCSLALIFLVQYIIIFTFAVNEALVKALAEAGGGADALVDAIENIKDIANDWLGMNSIPATIAYCMIIAQTIGLVFSYFNRMLKIAFLMIISPLITLTYSMDKMGDGKAQALNTWLKEFVYTVLLQSFHCIIYMAFIGMALSILDVGGNEENNLGGAILAVLCIKFTKDAEKILGKIFQFEGSTSESSIGAGMAMSAVALSQAKNIGKGARSTVNGVRNFATKAKDMGHATMTDLAALRLMTKSKDENGERMSYAEAKEQVETKREEKKAEKMQNKYVPSPKDPKYEDAVNKAAADLEKTGMSPRMAKAKARQQMAEKERQKKKDSKKPSTIKKAVGSVKNIYTQVKSTDLYKQLGGMAKTTIAGGMGLALGSMMYGTKGDAIGSIMAGVAAGKSVNEYFESSSAGMATEVRELAQGMGLKDKESTAQMLSDVAAKDFIYGNESNLDKELDNLLKFVEDALKQAIPDDDKRKKEAGTIRSSIKNSVASEIKKNPQISKDELFSKVLQNSAGCSEHFSSVMSSPDAKTSIHNVGNERRKKEVFDIMQKSSNLGLDSRVFESDVVRGMPSSTSRVKESPEEVVDSVNSGKTEVDEHIFENRSQEESDAIIDEMATQQAQAAAATQEAIAQGQAQDMVDELKRTEDKMLQDLIKMNELALQREVQRLQEEYQIFEREQRLLMSNSSQDQVEQTLTAERSRLETELRTKVDTIQTELQAKYNGVGMNTAQVLQKVDKMWEAQ